MRATLERASPARVARRPSRPQLIKAAVTTVLVLFALFALPELLSLYYIDTMTQVAVYSMVTLALGLLVGRVGLFSLGQAAVLAIGAWAAARLLFATTQPYPLVLLAAGLITMLAGLLINFPTQDSITLLAVTLMGGVFSLWGAVVAALLYQFLPALLNNWGISADWLIILFGVGVLQVLTTAPAGLADQVPRDLTRLGRFLRGRLPGRRAAPTRDGAP
jgi:ABC-type branched-subunit amino acid transport system permease subunit